ncbi:hypothetical protein EVAR_86867_1 [Eumeta japonica]|uniref:Uncharacterized protein n=1 Tax=Eumeta variegata TaxID=151549 RepID=A0A4C1VRY5_EUMVA|nr:hypothetical protein EVAR_86867_1 [Eumeta japonica]
MSERSFSEHAARGVVKNPLLSTAVTGLSLEDLTHNAVLLPVRSQDLGAGQECARRSLKYPVAHSIRSHRHATCPWDNVATPNLGSPALTHNSIS